jgi:DNA-directed RNA polymerase subunit RPC12/RpoP
MNYYYKKEAIGSNYWNASTEEKRNASFHSSEQNHDFGDKIKISGSLFYSNSMSPEDGDKYYCVSEFSFKDEPEEEIGSEITCPYCGYECSDSWSKSDEEDEFYCKSCGSTYSYTREVTAEYSSVPVKKNSDIKSISL